MTENPDVVNAIRAAKVEAAKPTLSPDEQGLLQEASSPGSVVYGILAWRSDSVMLARLRPLFMDMLADALAHDNCTVSVLGYECRNHDGMDRDLWCTPCLLQDHAERLEAVAKP